MSQSQKDVVRRAARVTGLTDALTHTQGAAAPDCFVLWTRQSDKRDSGEYIPLADLAVVALLPEVRPRRRGRYQLRLAALGAYLSHNGVRIGGDQYGGLWLTRRGVKTGAELGSAKAGTAPEGIFRVVDAPPAVGPFSLFSPRVDNRAALAAIDAVLERAEAEDGVSGQELIAPEFFASINNTAAIHPRIDDSASMEQLYAALLARSISGDWTLPRIRRSMTPELQPGATAIVSSVDMRAVTLKTADGGRLRMPVPERAVRAELARFGVRQPVAVTSMVRQGQAVMADTCLFGPYPPKSVGMEDVPKLGRDAVDALRRWIVAASATRHGERWCVPLSLAVPARAADVVARVPAAFQRIRADKLTTRLRSRSPGVSIDMWYMSARTQEAERMQRRR